MADRRLHFIGVTTGQSRIMDLFPVWSDELDLGAEIVGRDIEIGAEPEAFREPVREIRDRKGSRGALVTTHKVNVYEHARDLFDDFDRYAELTREVSCISKRETDEALVGHAKDPITAGQAMDHMLADDHWSRYADADVLCMGSGGAGTAITVRLLSDRPGPARVIATDKDPERLDEIRKVHERLEGVDAELRYEQVEGTAEHDGLLEELTPGSLVVNATGMGKDIPGSPISDEATFPGHAVAWELNYRGERPFLDQVREQDDALDVELHDGWRYFLHGWAEVIAEVFHLDLIEEDFQRLAEVAEPFRPS